MGKKLDAQIKQQKVYHRNKRLENYKSPFDCPKCDSPQNLRIETYKKEPKLNYWLAKCGNCDLMMTFETGKVEQVIDVLTRVCDIIDRDRT